MHKIILGLVALSAMLMAVPAAAHRHHGYRHTHHRQMHYRHMHDRHMHYDYMRHDDIHHGYGYRR